MLPLAGSWFQDLSKEAKKGPRTIQTQRGLQNAIFGNKIEAVPTTLIFSKIWTSGEAKKGAEQSKTKKRTQNAIFEYKIEAVPATQIFLEN